MGDYGFRPVAADDLPMLAGWLGQVQVARWWPAPIRENAGHADLTRLVVTRGTESIAYAQHYPAHRWQAPQFAHLPHDAVGIGLFSGPQGFGHGGAWLRQLGDDLLLRASMLVVDPVPGNIRAVRACRKAGFAGDVIRAGPDGQAVLVMTRRRQAAPPP